MVGLPGETEETRIANALLCAELELDMVGIGPFIPHPDTPLAGSPQEPSSSPSARRPRAPPHARSPPAGDDGRGLPRPRRQGEDDPRGGQRPHAQHDAVPARKNYLLYPGKICIDEAGEKCLGCLVLRMKSVDRELSFDRGDSPRLAARRRGAGGDGAYGLS